MAFQVFETKKQAESAAIERFSLCQFEAGCVYAVKVGSTIAKVFGVSEGWAISSEMDNE